MGDNVRLDAKVTGFVQGVGYRYYILRKVAGRNIVGYVRNLPGGRQVRVVAEGPSDQLEDLLQDIREGPEGSFVEQVDVGWSVASGEFSRFEVRY